EPTTLLEPMELAGCDMQLVEPVRDVRVIVENPRLTRPACAPGAVEPARPGRQRPQQELRTRTCRRDEIVALEPPPGLGECGHRQAVAGRDGLVVAQRLRPALPPREPPGARLPVEVAAQNEPAAPERIDGRGRDVAL